MWPIFQQLGIGNLRDFRQIVLMWILLLASTGCNVEPFEVLAPGFRTEIGTALVSVQVPPFSRGVIQRLRIRVTAADTGRIRAIEREMNFPIPGGNLSVGQVADIPAGRRRFTVTAFDTQGILRFRGVADSVVASGQTALIQVGLERIGGSINFRSVVNAPAILAGDHPSVVDSTKLASLPSTSILDVIELIDQPHHVQLAMLPLVSVGLGDQFSASSTGSFSRVVRISQIPTGDRRFVAHLRDLSSNGSIALADTVTATVDTFSVAEAVFNLKLVVSSDGLLEVFTKTTLPRDSTIVVVTPTF